MKATVDLPTLKDASGWISKRAGLHPTQPAVSGALLTVGDDTLTLAATDLTASGTATVPCDTLSTGTALVPAATLARVAAGLPGEDVRLELDGERLRVESGTSRFSLRCMPIEDFPTLPDVDAETAVDGAHLARVLSAVAMAASNDDARPILYGVHLQATGGLLTVAATDSYRLHTATLDWHGKDGAATIPADVARAVAKACGGDKAQLCIDSARVAVAMGERAVSTGVIEGRFPDWRQLIPASREYRVTVDPAVLTEVVRRCAIVGEQRKNGGSQVTLGIRAGKIAVSGARFGDEGADTVEADTGEADLDISLASAYVVDALAAVARAECAATLDLRDELKPVVFRADGFDGHIDPLALVMPIRL